MTAPRVVTPEQRRQGVIIRAGNATMNAPYITIAKLPGGNWLVREPEWQEDPR